MDIEKSDKFAGSLIDFIKQILTEFGVSRFHLDEWEEMIYVVLIIGISFMIGYLALLSITSFFVCFLKVKVTFYVYWWKEKFFQGLLLLFLH